MGGGEISQGENVPTLLESRSFRRRAANIDGQARRVSGIMNNSAAADTEYLTQGTSSAHALPTTSRPARHVSMTITSLTGTPNTPRRAP